MNNSNVVLKKEGCGCCRHQTKCIRRGGNKSSSSRYKSKDDEKCFDYEYDNLYDYKIKG